MRAHPVGIELHVVLAILPADEVNGAHAVGATVKDKRWLGTETARSTRETNKTACSPLKLAALIGASLFCWRVPSL